MNFNKGLASGLTSVFLLTLLLVTFSSEINGALTPEQIALIEDILVNQTLRDRHVTGLSISIVQGDGFNDIFSQGYGFRNVAKGLPATNETLYGVGSLSKMIASLYITKILNDKFPDRGESVLDVPIRTLAPGYNFTFGDRFRSEYATFRDLLAHKVCLQKSTEVTGLVGAFVDKEDVVYRQRYCPESCGFRHPGWHYNNAMVHVAAEVAAHIQGTGEAFEDLLEKFLQTEAGMSDTRVIRATDDYDEIPNMSQGYYRRNDETHVLNLELIKRSAVIAAAGGILTSSNDMSNFMAIIGTYGKRMDGVQVVGEHIIKWMSRNSNAFQTSYKSNEGDRPRGDSGYGIGLILGANDGFERLRHIGYITPYTSIMNVYPKLKLGVFTVTNGPSRHLNHDVIQDEVFEIIRGIVGGPNRGLTREFEPSKSVNDMPTAVDGVFIDLPFLPEKEQHSETPVLRNTVQRNHSELVGMYGSVIGGSFEILDVNETTLYIKYGEWGTGELIQRVDEPTKYEAIIDSDLPENFYAEDTDMPQIFVDFTTPLKALLNFGGIKIPFDFEFRLDNLPPQPYPDDSCGPVVA